jgi:hypothetical protein
MPNALRRKMFKLGGVANTHGVGITSGLKFKKGGRVEPQATFGVGNNALRKIGPDGKEREAHVAFLPLLGLGTGATGAATGVAATLGRLVGLPALRALGSAIKQGTTQPLRQFVTKGDDIIKMVRPDRAALGQSRIAAEGAYSPVISRVVGQTTPSGITQAARVAQLISPFGVLGGAGALGTGATMAALDRAGITKPGEDDSFLESSARLLGKAGVNLSVPGLAFAGVGAALGKEDRPTRKSLFDLLAGTKLDDKKDDDDEKDTEEGDPMTTAENIEAEMEALKEKALMRADLYRDVVGTAALAAGSAQLLDEAAKREELDQKLTGQAVTDVLRDQATQQAILADAAKLGPTNLLQTQRVLEGLNAGITEQLQVDAKNNVLNARKGTVLIDVTGVTGKKFFATNKDGESETFNDPEKAKEFAETRSA